MIPQDFINVKEELEKGYHNEELVDALPRRTYYELQGIQSLLISDMEKGFRDLKVDLPIQEEVDCILENLRLIENTIIINFISEPVKRYILNLILLVSHWNSNLLKSKELETQIEVINNLLSFHLSLKEMINMNKIILREMIKYKDYRPVSYDTALHFTKKLDQAIREKGAIINERNK